MNTASALRAQIEAALADRIPSALTPAPRLARPAAPTGIATLDALLEGGLPLGAITEVVGPECSGRTSLALSFVARMTEAKKVCAWIDVSNALDPESAAAIGVDLERLLWVRCGAAAEGLAPALDETKFTLPQKYLIPAPTMKGLHGGGCGPHPRGEAKGLSDAVGGFLRPEAIAPRCAEPLPREARQPESLPAKTQTARLFNRGKGRSVPVDKPWQKIDQALRVTDLLLQGGGFGAIVLDMGGIAPEYASRVPLATWFRYRAAAERTQASILLLTQHACAKSSAGLLLRLQPGLALEDEATVFPGVEQRAAVSRERFLADSKVVPLRKPPHSERGASWHSRTAWAGRR